MKKIILLFFLCSGLLVNGQDDDSAFKLGEWLKFRIHYGFLNASYATLQVKSANIDSIPVYRVVGKGETAGFASIFFKVDDTYESYFDKEDGRSEERRVGKEC